MKIRWFLILMTLTVAAIAVAVSLGIRLRMEQDSARRNVDVLSMRIRRISDENIRYAGENAELKEDFLAVSTEMEQYRKRFAEEAETTEPLRQRLEVLSTKETELLAKLEKQNSEAEGLRKRIQELTVDLESNRVEKVELETLRARLAGQDEKAGGDGPEKDAGSVGVPSATP